MSLAVSIAVPLVAVPLGILALWAGCSYFTGRHFVENAKYRVLRRYEDSIELRLYEPCIIAEVAVPKSVEPDFRRAQNVGFRKIAGFIFGANSLPDGAGEKISMTSPVIASSAKGAAVAMTSPVIARDSSGDDADSERAHLISFVMPSSYKTVSALPTPHNREVHLREVKARTELVLSRRGGYISVVERDAMEQRLIRAAEREGLRPLSSAKSYSYDPPWSLWIMMLNEVAIEVDAAQYSPPLS